ncbi:MAG: VCBS repeat-containing protein [Planctomycetota bacterium]
MNHRAPWFVCLLAFLTPMPVAVAREFGEVSLLQTPEGAEWKDVIYADVDGDGRRDLVLSAWSKAGRSIRVHLQQPEMPRFRSKPDHLLEPVWKDTVAFAVADVHEAPGSEVVLFNASGAWAWRPGAPEKERPRKLFEAALLWQIPESRDVIAWQEGTRDVDGDGLPDFVIPEPGQYRIVLQDRSGKTPAFKDAGLCRVRDVRVQKLRSTDVRKRARQERDRFAIKISMGSDPLGPLLSITDSVPAPQWADFDGDGDLDLLVATERHLLVWLQDKKRIGPAPSFRMALPVVADRERRLDVSYSAHVLDLNGDKRTDCVIFSGDKRSEKIRTQVQFFLNGGRGTSEKIPLFGKEQFPQQLLVLTGLTGDPHFTDVNGDGTPDLVVGKMRPDMLDKLRGSGGDRIRAELIVFLNKGGRFSKRPDLLYRTAVQATALRLGRRVIQSRFFADLSGDGIRELLVRNEEKSLKVLYSRRRGDSWTVLEEPLWSQRVDKRARVIVPTPTPTEKKDILILESYQLLHVRFR